ncbi:MAG: flagellin [Sporomusaceae bacterium]|jgi:flagellin|nr:flagellin [Sporomusaceae bacterium]
MIINHNLPALNTWNYSENNNLFVDKSIAKLASGLRINKAADDAAGLAIREKMRAQIRGIDQGYANAQDGISLIQTAEGGMGTIQDTLHRMRELSVQAANDTVTDGDRELIQTEIDELVKNIDQIANDTEFNTLKLLNGGVAVSTGGTGGTGSPAGGKVISLPPGTPSGSTSIAKGSSLIDLSKVQKVRFTEITNYNGNYYNTIEFTIDQLKAGTAVWYAPHAVNPTAEPYYFSIDLVNNTITSSAVKMGNNFDIVQLIGVSGYSLPTGTTGFYADRVTWQGTFAANQGPENSLGNYPNGALYVPLSAGPSTMTWSFSGDPTGSTPTIQAGDPPLPTANTTSTPTTPSTADTDGLVIHVGPNTDQEIRLPLPVDMRASAFGLGPGQPSVTTRAAADSSIERLDIALARVSTIRAGIGAMQNRLEHAMENNAVYSVNLSAAESRISDVNMAKEMTSFTKHQMLLQSSQAMLSQANTQPQSVLQLLR